MGKSKLRIFKRLAVAAMALTALSSCSKFDEMNNDGILTDYGIAHEYNGDVLNYYIERDDGALLYIDNSASNDDIREGKRVKVYYQIKNRSEGSFTAATSLPTEIFDITLYAIIKVPVREPFFMSTVTQDKESAIGDDQLERITRLFFSGGYLNVEYKVAAKTEGFHNMTLLVDDRQFTEEGLTFYIRYKADSTESQSVSSNTGDEESEVSFNMAKLEEFITEEQKTLRINFVWRESGKGIVTKTGIFTLDPRSYKQIVGSANGNYSSALPVAR